jgi:hypothetical protein
MADNLRLVIFYGATPLKSTKRSIFFLITFISRQKIFSKKRKKKKKEEIIIQEEHMLSVNTWVDAYH